MNEILYFIEAKDNNKPRLLELLSAQKQIKFVSLSAVDLGNNHTDEKIVISKLIDDYEGFIKKGIQTDGSSVFLPLIADINHAQVSLIPDLSVKWFVDYNYEHIDTVTGRPVGTLVIPAFIEHEGRFVCSRSILKRASEYFESEIKSMFETTESFRESVLLEKKSKIKRAEVTVATELEFWVNTPDNRPDRKSILTSQQMKEQYWKRTIGKVRTALEKSILSLGDYGLDPEMGHKEVGGASAKLRAGGDYDFIYEQLELDWAYDGVIQAADNEMFARDIVKDVFEREGLHVSFKAKPIEGAAGSGEHHHIGVRLIDEDGYKVNAFHPRDSKNEYLSSAGYAALMGLLKNYEIISPFVSSSNNAFRRLVPGFEAPVSIVSSLGHSVSTPSRNRSVLIDLIRDPDNAYACRFELRAPNPLSNSFLLLSASLLCMLDGLRYAQNMKKNSNDLRRELLKKYGEEADYLLKDREYISQNDVFEAYTEEEREKLFGIPPKTVYENLKLLENGGDSIRILTDGAVFDEKLIASYKATIFSQWINELEHRIIKRAKSTLRSMVKRHSAEEELNLHTEKLWGEISEIKTKLLLAPDDKALITQLELAIAMKDYERVNELQIEISKLRIRAEDLYAIYSVSR